MPLAAAAMPVERVLDPDAGAVTILEVVGVRRPVPSSEPTGSPEPDVSPPATLADGEPRPGSARSAYGLAFDHGGSFGAA
jgi:hypothetical protein